MSVEEAAADVVEVARELELEVGLKMALNCCPLLRKRTDEELLLIDGQRNWSPERKSTPGDDVGKSVPTTTKDLEYPIDLADKAAPGFKRISSNVERGSLVGKTLSSGITHYTEIVTGRVNPRSQLHGCLTLRNSHGRPRPSAATP